MLEVGKVDHRELALEDHKNLQRMDLVVSYRVVHVFQVERNHIGYFVDC